MKLFVGNLPLDTDDEQLRQVFEKYGAVTSAQIIKEKFSGESRGFGFVEMPSVTEARAAISELDGNEILGRPLNVNEARPPVRGPRTDRGRQSNRRRDARRGHGKKRGRKHRGSWGF